MLENIKLKVILLQFNGFWRWWSCEIIDLYESIFLFDKNNIAMFVVNKDANVSFSNENEILKISKRKIRLSLPEQFIMYRMIRLPLNARNNLGHVIRYEFDKYFPLQYADVYCGRKILPESSENNINVGLWVVRKESMDKILADIKNKYNISARYTELVDSHGDTLVEIQTEDTKNINSDRASNNPPFIGYFIFVLLALCLFIPIYKMNIYNEKLGLEITQLEEKAKSVIVIKNKMAIIEGGLNQVVGIKKSMSKFTRLWSDITKIVGGQGQLSLIKFSDGKATIKGKVFSVEKIIKNLKKNKKYEKISIDSPVRRLSLGKYESMNVSFLVSK